MTDPTDVIERAQAWLAEADKKGINRTDRYGYLAVIEDLVAEVEFQRTALQGYRNRQLELTEERDSLLRFRAAFEQLKDNAEEWECDGLGLWAQHGWWEAVDEELDKIDADRDGAATDLCEPISRAE